MLEEICEARFSNVVPIECCGDCGQIDRKFVSTLSGPKILFCPLRIGLEKINGIYIEQLKVPGEYCNYSCRSYSQNPIRLDWLEESTKHPFSRLVMRVPVQIYFR